MMGKWTWLLIPVTFWAHGGEVVVRNSSDPPFDAFALKRQLMTDATWREMVRQQQTLKWVESLPIWCTRDAASGGVTYTCDGFYYRPFPYEGRDGYLQVDPPVTTRP